MTGPAAWRSRWPRRRPDRRGVALVFPAIREGRRHRRRRLSPTHRAGKGCSPDFHGPCWADDAISRFRSPRGPPVGHFRRGDSCRGGRHPCSRAERRPDLTAGEYGRSSRFTRVLGPRQKANRAAALRFEQAGCARRAREGHAAPCSRAERRSPRHRRRDLNRRRRRERQNRRRTRHRPGPRLRTSRPPGPRNLDGPRRRSIRGRSRLRLPLPSRARRRASARSIRGRSRRRRQPRNRWRRRERQNQRRTRHCPGPRLRTRRPPGSRNLDRPRRRSIRGRSRRRRRLTHRARRRASARAIRGRSR